jgi:hypothetical protein
MMSIFYLFAIGCILLLSWIFGKLLTRFKKAFNIAAILLILHVLYQAFTQHALLDPLEAIVFAPIIILIISIFYFFAVPIVAFGVYILMTIWRVIFK